MIRSHRIAVHEALNVVHRVVTDVIDDAGPDVEVLAVLDHIDAALLVVLNAALPGKTTLFDWPVDKPAHEAIGEAIE